MKNFISGSAVILFGFLICQNNISAQDYRIYTHVLDHRDMDANGKPKVVARSLTIWHAGKVYDYMVNVDELVIYDPFQQRFTIISSQHNMACTLDFSELKQHQKVARRQAKEYLEELSESNETRQAELIAFQLDPQFEIEYRPEDHHLACKSPYLSYVADAIPAPNKDTARAFRQYADWSAQLNFVLHGKSLMPAARLRLNEELEKHDLIPVKVTLSLADSANSKLSAEHAINWELGKHDRFRITEWKHLLQDGQLKFVSFQDYQRNLLAEYSR